MPLESAWMLLRKTISLSEGKCTVEQKRNEESEKVNEHGLMTRFENILQKNRNPSR